MIALAGNMIVDHIKQIDRLPARSALAPIRGITTSTGGVCNTAMDLAQLDPTLALAAYGIVGDDADGARITAALAGCGIDTRGIARRGTTSFTDVFSETEGGCRTFFQYGGANDTLDVGDIPVDTLNCTIFHLAYLLLLPALDAPDADYGTRAARLLAAVQARGILTSIDVVSEDSDRFTAVVPPALKYTDLLTINETEAERTTGIHLRAADGALLTDAMPAALSALLDLGVGRWAVIHCPEGAFGMAQNRTFVQVASRRLPAGYIRGTVGAGDAFCAGVLLAAYRGLSLDEALRCGSAAAQVSLRSISATDGIIPIDEALAEYDRLA